MWDEPRREPPSPIVFERARMTDPDRISHDVKPVRSSRDAAERWAWHLWAAHDDDMGDEGRAHHAAGCHDAPHHTIHWEDWKQMITSELGDGMTPDEHEQLIQNIEYYLETKGKR